MKSKKQKGTSVNPKRSGKSSPSTLSLKKQVEIVNEKTAKVISEMASNPDITFCEFVKQTRKVSEAFRIMNTAIELGEKMEKLKKE